MPGLWCVRWSTPAESRRSCSACPRKPSFSKELRAWACDSSEAVMIRDHAESEVAGMLSAGPGRGALVRKGKYSEGDEIRFNPRPTLAAHDVREAVDTIIDERTRGERIGQVTGGPTADRALSRCIIDKTPPAGTGRSAGRRRSASAQ
ncbi:HAD hydrolase-like protein [Tropicimonas aquimaris]|uniref:HAD hydrolase-like protein n=1 Tax=Tropicimonas aquimaris TaxID=914152 RepID=A0ABW3ISC7_9RHOB